MSDLDNIPPFPGQPSTTAHYKPGVIFPWYAADNKFMAKRARKNVPEGWEYAGKTVKLRPKTDFNPDPSGIKYVLYLRKV